MARVRTNFLRGQTTNNPLAAAGTTLNSSELADLPAITSGEDYAVLVIDPTGSAPEIVYVTAHTAAATSATISRGKEGSAAAEWASGTTWICAGTTKDFNTEWDMSIDNPVNWSGSSYDEEFDRGGSPTSPPTNWSWLNQGTATYVEKFGAGAINAAAAAGNNWKAIERAIPSEGTWTAIAKVCINSYDYNYATGGIHLRDSVGGKIVSFTQSFTGANALSIGVYHLTNATTWAATQSEARIAGPIRYFKIKKNSATSYDVSWSMDGAAWNTFLSGYNPQTFLGTAPTHIGFGVESNNSTNPISGSIDWFRVET